MFRLVRPSAALSAGLSAALALGTGIALSGCQQAQQTLEDTTSGVGDAAKDAATATGQAALAPAVTPVLDLLKKGEGEVKAGNLAAAVATMGGFKGLWDKAAPVIQPLAGDKWPAIEMAANTVISTFGGGTPDAGAASSAISGLIGPLSGLIGQ
ncbi:hypothetical protein [Cyanobium sp. CH-040]|uniref:hypothetical protein n=1 Tax=Cyanobium sp. CH-040 TaxID=2823708 RepID=UPI0020CCC5D6|nr:hypothetical protein [Cyanobium sp. CH-040]MCP9927059.1 hypothetical protein [Cyanobium sp. CH-040]